MTFSFKRLLRPRTSIVISLAAAHWLSTQSVTAQVPPPPAPPGLDEVESQATITDSPATPDASSRIDEKAEISKSEQVEPSLDAKSEAEEPVELKPAQDENLNNPPSDEPLKQAALEALQTSLNPEEKFKQWWRTYQIRTANSLTGSTGLLRVHEAGSGPVWSFRFQVLAGYMGKTGFLCTRNAPCELPDDGRLVRNDSVRSGEGSLSLSLTPARFLEVFANLRSTSISNNAGEPQVLQVLGDISLGAKAFTPHQPGRLWSLGGELDIALKSGSGGVGFDAAATSPSFRALSTFDFNNYISEDRRFPMRLHANVGFTFDNTGRIVDDFEANELNNISISRISRYGLGISKVNFLNIALGAEYTNPWIRPFFEFSVDIASNYLKGYECRSPNVGEACLFNESGLGYMPSRLTLGAHGYPLQDSGFNITAAVDIGTGAARRFIEEVKPESLYKLWLGLSYAVDPLAPKETILTAVPVAGTYTPEPRRYVLGRISDENTQETIAGAILKYDELNMTGLVANNAGLFVSPDLPPGEYKWSVTAEGYRPGECRASIRENLPDSIPQEPLETAPTNDELIRAEQALKVEVKMDPEPQFDDGPSTPTAVDSEETDEATVQFPTSPYLDGDNIMFPIECKLKELPEIATINGLLVDATTGGTVLDARVVITDKLKRSLELMVDPDGSFQFRNVPFGKSRIVAHAPGYLSTVSPIELENRQDKEIHLVMNPRPEVLSAQFSEDLTRIELNKKLHFIANSLEIAADSMIVVEEVALLLEENEDLREIEIVVHTDDSDSETLQNRLSKDRAEAVKKLLAEIAINSSAEIITRGAGPSEPLTPNTSEEARKLNERVEFNIKFRTPLPQ